MKEKTLALAMLKEGASIAHISKHEILKLKQAAKGLPDNTMPTRKAGTGIKKTTTDGTNVVWPRDVMLNPSITTANLKKKQPMLLQDISIRPIKHRPRNYMLLPSRCADKKPLLTSPMKKRRPQFCNDYLHWTSADSNTVIISGESTFRLVRRSPGSSRYNSKSTGNMVKYPESVIVWAVFSRNNCRCGLFFLSKNITLAGANYFEVPEQHMLSIWDFHQCHHFKHDGAPVH